MKRLWIMLLLGFGVGARAQQPETPTHPLVGSWEMVSQTFIHPNRVEQPLKMGESLPGNRKQIKLLSETRFAFGRQSADGEEITAGGGRYEIDGDMYTEIIDYHTSPPLVGTRISFTWLIEGDLWHHSGKIGTFQLEEVYRRVKP
ncbi:MAG: hypothetical protein SH809_20175 [Rhodothermales bacterium]|nr:hypothetical protein [Rhodothermales bacterium]